MWCPFGPTWWILRFCWVRQGSQLATLVQYKQILNSWFLNLLNHEVAIQKCRFCLNFSKKSTWPLWSTDLAGRQAWKLHRKKNKKLSSHLFLRFCVLTMFRNACLWNIGSLLAAALLRAFQHPANSMTWWAGPRIYHKRRVYGLPRATYVAMFIAFLQNFSTGDLGIFLLISS